MFRVKCHRCGKLIEDFEELDKHYEAGCEELFQKEQTPELFPCPCCGSEKSTVLTGSIVRHEINIWKIFCPKCQLRTGPEVSLKIAAKVWNTRK